MATVLQIRRGTAAEAAAITCLEGELYIDLDNNKIYLHDGVTVGGHPIDTEFDDTALLTLINSKQAVLISGTTIKTVNGSSLLGSGNVQIDMPVIPVQSVNGQTGDVQIDIPVIPDIPVQSVNGQTGDVQINEFPSTSAELLQKLYQNPLPFIATSIVDGGLLKITFTDSILSQIAADDETLRAFGKSLHNSPNYDIFIGNQPPLTTSWNLPQDELNRTFVCASLIKSSQIDNGDGTYTLNPTLIRASIPDAFDISGPTSWIQMDLNQLLAAIEGNDVTGLDQNGHQVILVTGSQEYAQDLINELSNLQCYSKYSSTMHLLAASLGDFIQ